MDLLRNLSVLLAALLLAGSAAFLVVQGVLLIKTVILVSW